jgi:hypothetical protein
MPEPTAPDITRHLADGLRLPRALITALFPRQPSDAWPIL